MKRNTLTIMIFALLITWISGCGATKPMTVTAPPLAACPLPDGYQMEPAIQTAKQTLSSCPEKLDAVFTRLLEIARHSPGPKNGVLIQDLLKELIRQNKISGTYARSLYQKYFSRTFVSLPDIKVYRLAGELKAVKKSLKNELALKKIGMVECCGDRESYDEALNEYARTISFMENLVLNEDYLKES